MSLDYSEIMIGEPGEVMERLALRLGELNFSSANLKLGMSDDPCRVWRGQGGEEAWPVMKLLYLTHSPAQARQMADLLRAWDAKLFLRADLGQYLDPENPPAQPGRQPGRRYPGRHAASIYAFALIR
jgi:hypothetical protein